MWMYDTDTTHLPILYICVCVCVCVPKIFLSGGGADSEVIYNSYFIKKIYVMKTISKSPNRHLFRLQGKLKLTEKIHIQNFLSFFQNSNVLVISQFQWLI